MIRKGSPQKYHSPSATKTKVGFGYVHQSISSKRLQSAKRSLTIQSENHKGSFKS